VAAIEAELPHDAMVFQMPYQPFPEGGKLERAFDTDHLKGYLNSHDLRWSFGGMKGRETDWQEDLRGQPVELVVTRLLAVGFRGIWIDRFAYADGGDAVESALTSLLHSPDIVSQDGRLSFFSLMDAPSDLNVGSPSDRHALAESTLHPVRHRWETGFNQVTQESDDWWLDAAPTAEVGLYNPSESPRKLVVDFALQTRGPRTQIVHVTYPGGVERLEVTSAGTGMHRVITVPSGRTTIKFQLESKASAGTEGEPLRLLRPAIYEAQIS
jgi:phosphoglycerol transferase